MNQEVEPSGVGQPCLYFTAHQIKAATFVTGKAADCHMLLRIIGKF